MRIPSSTRPSAARAAAQLLLLVCLFAGCQREKAEYRLDGVVEAPGGNYRAVRLTGMGGGAAGWCSRYVLVEPGAKPLRRLRALQEEAWKAPVQLSCAGAMRVEWAGPRDLRIAFAVEENGTRAELWPTAAEGEVRVHYQLLQP